MEIKQVKKCDCYHWREKYTYDTLDPMIDGDKKFVGIVGECWGTKEKDLCNCKGDKTKCDFYSDIRKKAMKEQRQAELNKMPNKISNLIYEFWGTDPTYYTSSTDKREADFAKLSSAIIEMLLEFRHD